MTSYKIEQQHVHHGGRDFHFVTYDATPANEKKGESAVPMMWYLMGPARRWAVMPHVVGQPEAEVVKGLTGWLREQGLVTGR